MLNLEKYIRESQNAEWEFNSDIDGYGKSVSFSVKNKWLYINTETLIIAPVDEKTLNSYVKEFDMDPEELKDIKNLKVGESYDADGGITIYVRIK